MLQHGQAANHQSTSKLAEASSHASEGGQLQPSFSTMLQTVWQLSSLPRTSHASPRTHANRLYHHAENHLACFGSGIFCSMPICTWLKFWWCFQFSDCMGHLQIEAALTAEESSGQLSAAIATAMAASAAAGAGRMSHSSMLPAQPTSAPQFPFYLHEHGVLWSTDFAWQTNRIKQQRSFS